MENTNKKYWKGVEELKNDIGFVKNANREFNLDDIDTVEPTHRRDFLKVLGFSMAAVSLAACDAPVRKAIPYLNKPESVEPGIPNWYASTYAEAGEYCSILVKTREGRPVKIEGNKLSSVTKGAVNARVHASVLSLYDNEKLKAPQKGSAEIKWEDLDKEIIAALSKGGEIRIVSNTILSPTTKKVIADFSTKYGAKHITYDANSSYAIVQANEASFGQAVIPSYDFSKANVIVGINADFLGTWIAPNTFAGQWSETRKLTSGKGGKRTMSRHYQFETGLTITGASADYRGMMKPSQEGAVALALYNKIAGKSGSAGDVQYIDKCATDLIAAKGAALVVSGSNNPAVQTIVNAINSLLGSYGTTIDLGTPVNYRQGNDAEMTTFINEVKGGKISTAIFLSNPVYDHARGTELGEALSKVATTVSFADRADETASKCKYIAPAPHYLESWNDAEPKKGFYSLTQPTISLIFNTRQAQSSLLTWAGMNADYQAYLKSNWTKNILSGKSWVQALHDGVYEPGAGASASGASFNGNVDAAAAEIAKIKGTGIEVGIYESVSIGTGLQANNPWLQEMPDPISKVTWENVIAVSQKTAKEVGVEQGDWAKVTVAGKTIELPVLIQPGQANGTFSIALGYGRTAAGKSGNTGENIYPWISNGQYWANDAKIEKTKDGYTLAQTQTHSTLMGRTAVVQESVLGEYVENVKAGRYEPKIETSEGEKSPYQITLWNGHEKQNHSWGMVIDLNSCTGCGSCLVSCQAENNVAVVGKAEVARAREMHWIRIDRYYSSEMTHDEALEKEGPIGGYKALEIAAENPEVVFQPMMCQHCSNAPCETVCPVLATTHSSEGLNQMTYNRCIGTRYCANNCPYKVRRFNWFKYFENDNFDYHMNSDLGRMVLNPDVTVRSRGVIEKCSMCVQRIQAGKLNAKKERRRPIDGEIVTACSQSCPTNAITFGDMLDPESQISKMLEVEKEGRAFNVLEEINVRPQMSYLTKIRNKDGVVKAAKAEKKEEHHS
jgi:MoCo/4Fe-4S cofactor protein with predicted Tat translocation signal